MFLKEKVHYDVTITKNKPLKRNWFSNVSSKEYKFW